MNRRLFLGSLAALPIALLASPGGVYSGPRRVVRRWRINEGGPEFEVYDLRDLKLKDGPSYKLFRIDETVPAGWMLDKHCGATSLYSLRGVLLVSAGALA